MEREAVTQKVQDFYSSLPFNFHGTKEQAARTIRGKNQVEVYQNLHRVFQTAPPGQTVCDVGCGSGWFVNSITFHYGLTAVGFDLCEPALERAREVSLDLGISKKTTFRTLDLFAACELEARYFLVNSIGVLHHTFDCSEALRSISCLVQEGGYIHIGLYHRYGREPFLSLFEKHRERISLCPSPERAEIEQEAYALYKRLNRHITDESFLSSWFRDQVFHPHESQHTLEELSAWLGELGFQCLSTSLNHFEEVTDWKRIFEEEEKMREISYQRNYIERTYFPGFFTVLARKR